MKKIRFVTGIAMLLAVPCLFLSTRDAGAQELGRRHGDREIYTPSRASLLERCGSALEERIRGEHPHTDKVEILDRSVSEWAYSRSEVAVAGEGRMLRGRSWDDFDFVCLVEMRSNRVSALEWSGPLRDDGTPVRPGVQRPTRLLSALTLEAAAGRGCSEAVAAEIRREHPRSGRIDFERPTLRQWRRSQSEVGARGEGRFAGFRGRPHEFEFACVWDARRGAVTAVFYELQ